MAKKYKILEHRADLKIKVFGKNKRELFKNATWAMFDAAGYKTAPKSPIKKRKVKIKSFDLASLLINFLNEVLYLAETKREVYQKVEFKKLTENKLECTLFGKKLERMGVHIKGATFYGLKITKEKNKAWSSIILFDI